MNGDRNAMPAKIEPTASTNSGIIMLGGDSCAWSKTRDGPR
jgi:hypothetical protein